MVIILGGIIGMGKDSMGWEIREWTPKYNIKNNKMAVTKKTMLIYEKCVYAHSYK